VIGGRSAGAVAAGVQLGAQLGVQLGVQLGLPAAAVPGPGTDPYPPKLAGRAVDAPNPAGWYRGPVPVRWTASDGWSGLAGTPPVVDVDGEGDALVAAATAFDRAGNHRTALSRPVLKIDRTPPVTVLEAPPGWASTDRSVGLAATDNLSGVATTWSRVDGGEPQSGELVTLPGPGDHTVEYWSADRAGNQERRRTVTLHLDERAPTLTHRVLPAGNPAGWHRGPVRVEFGCRPGAAPVARCPAPARVAGDGTTLLAGTAVDRSGRRSVDPVTVNVDTVAPVLGVRADHVPGRGGWYGEPLTLTFSCRDDRSGIPADGCPEPVTVSEGAGQEVTVDAVDVAGNRTALTVQGLDVDTGAPVTRVRTEPGTRAGRAVVVVRLAATDRLSGVAGTSYRLDGGPARPYRGPLTVTGDGVHRLTYRTVDRAGNVDGGTAGRLLTLRVGDEPPAGIDPGVSPDMPSVG
jgi:hypothetical protein